MNTVDNPYTPGAGLKPPILAGRDKELAEAGLIFKKTKTGNVQRSLALYGLRGVGKTVLLNSIEEKAKSEGFLCEHIEVSEKDDFKKLIARTIRKILLQVSGIENAKDKVAKAFRVLKAFTCTIPDGPEFSLDIDKLAGEGDSGNTEQDVIDLMVNLGEAAKESGKYVCIAIDEVQYLKENDFSALLTAIHRCNQLTLPLVTVCAGLPQIAALAGDARSYAERIYHYANIDSLEEPMAIEALVSPAKNLGVEYEKEAYKYVIEKTEGYPFFIQEFGKHIWDISDNPITLERVKNAFTIYRDSLDDGFYKVRMDRATNAEKNMMKTMAELGKGPYSMSDVADKLNRKTSSLGPTRAGLIKKGFIYSPNYNSIEFTVPSFDEYIRRKLK
jgi:AAA+ ATPase superfamily predicted ATPase